MDREITDRLADELKAQVSFADNLKPALNLASRQLEFLCPAVMGMTDKGLVATRATTLPRGTWLIVLANARKVMTIYMTAPPDGVTRFEVLEHCVEAATEALGQPPSQRDVLATIGFAVDQNGGQPGKRSPEVDQGVAARILGLLFGAVSFEDRAKLVKGVDALIAADVCPLHVGLIGKGSTKGTTSGVWPLALPFARYVDSLGL